MKPAETLFSSEISEDAEQQLIKRIVTNRDKIKVDPEFSHYSDEKVFQRAVGLSYNNWFLRLPRPDGGSYRMIDQTQIRRIAELLTELDIDVIELNKYLRLLFANASLSNPAHVQIDLLTRPALLEMMKRYGYTIAELTG